jgi:mycothiol synthase
VLDLVVAPDARGAGLGRQLAEAACAAPGLLRAWSHGDHIGARRLADRLGFTADRELWVMRRPAGVLLEGGGVLVRAFTEADTDGLLAVNAAAFAHHREQGAMDAAGLAERMAEPWFDPADLLVAEDTDGSILGFHWTKLHDARHGEVYVVGVAPQAQGRGLGRVLTVAGLNHLTERGAEEILLYVESDNRPARGLYEGLGFTHDPADTHVQFRRSA